MPGKPNGDAESMHHPYWEIALVLYFLVGVIGYGTIGGAGAELEPAKKPSLFRRALIVVLWPLAMIGAIEG